MALTTGSQRPTWPPSPIPYALLIRTENEFWPDGTPWHRHANGGKLCRVVRIEIANAHHASAIGETVQSGRAWLHGNVG